MHFIRKLIKHYKFKTLLKIDYSIREYPRGGYEPKHGFLASMLLLIDNFDLIL